MEYQNINLIELFWSWRRIAKIYRSTYPITINWFKNAIDLLFNIFYFNYHLYWKGSGEINFLISIDANLFNALAVDSLENHS